MTFQDLKEAILEVLENSERSPVSDNCRRIPLKKLEQLQIAYNLYFVEPEDEQLDVI
jgi:hypothetical protein